MTKIEEIVEKAMKLVNERYNGPGTKIATWPSTRDYARESARLMAEECAKVCENFYGIGTEWKLAGNQLAEQIRRLLAPASGECDCGCHRGDRQTSPPWCGHGQCSNPTMRTCP